MRNTKSTLRLTASVIFFIVGLVALWAKTISSVTSIGYVLGNGLMRDIFSLQFLSAALLVFPAAIALGVIGLLKGRDKLLLWGSIAVWAWCLPVVWVSFIGANGIEVLFNYPVDVFIGSQWPDQVVTIGLTAATGLVVLASLQPNVVDVQEQAAVVQQGQMAESPLPILALVGAFLFPIIGIVLGHLSLSQMKAGIMSSRNRGLAQAALAVSYTIIGIALCYLIWILVMIASIFNYNY